MLVLAILISVIVNTIAAFILIAVARKTLSSKTDLMCKMLNEGSLLLKRIKDAKEALAIDDKKNQEIRDEIRKDILAGFDTEATTKLARDKLASLISDDEELRSMFVEQANTRKNTEASSPDLCSLALLTAFMGGVENGKWPEINKKLLAMTFFIPAIRKTCTRPVYPITYTLKKEFSKTNQRYNITVNVSGYCYDSTSNSFYMTSKEICATLSLNDGNDADDNIIYKIFRQLPADVDMDNMVDYFHNKGDWG